jgi:hypothetical protein
MKLLAVLAVVVLTTLSASAEEAQDRRWTRFGRGTWVKVKTTTKLSSEEMVEETKFTLSDVTAESYLLKIEASMGGNALPVEELRIPLTGPANPEWTWEDAGTEQVEIAGKGVPCVVKKGTGADKTSTWKVWVAELNGERVEVKSEKVLRVLGTERKETSRVTALDESVTVGQKTVTCWVRETLLEYDGQKVEAKLWESAEVPGRTVRSESKATAGSLPMTSVREVVEFEAK